MNGENEVYGKYEDETGEAYYCPIDATDSRILPLGERDDCVEASTAGRYSGNLNVVRRYDS